MVQGIPIQLHVANALQWLATLYRNPADDRCDVKFTLDRRHVTIEYPYGMSRTQFEDALHIGLAFRGIDVYNVDSFG